MCYDYDKYQTGNPTLHVEDVERKLGEIMAVLPPRLNVDTLVDVGCGSGLLGHRLAAHVAAGSYVGLDISRTILRAAETATRDLGRNATFVLGSRPSDLPSVKPSLVLLADILEHVTNPSDMLSDWLAV